MLLIALKTVKPELERRKIILTSILSFLLSIVRRIRKFVIHLSMFSSKCSGKSCYPKQYWEICNISFKMYLLGLSEATFKTMPHCQNQWNTCLTSDTGCVKQSANCYCFGDNYMDQQAEKKCLWNNRDSMRASSPFGRGKQATQAW